jgi:hypothetical protein
MLDHLAQKIGVGTLLSELGKCDSGFGGGHRDVPP